MVFAIILCLQDDVEHLTQLIGIIILSLIALVFIPVATYISWRRYLKV